MANLVKKDGSINYGLYKNVVDQINFKDFDLKTPVGKKITGLKKKIKLNQFNFFGISGPEIMVGIAIVDLKYLTNGFVYIYEKKSMKIIEENKISIIPSPGTYIKPYPEIIDSRFNSVKLKIRIKNKKVRVIGKNINICIDYNTKGSEPLRICTKAGYSGWTYTQKTAPVEVSGFVQYEESRIDLTSPSYQAIIDWTTGYMRRNTFWSWASAAATLSNGKSFGLNLSCGVNETGFTENAFWIDGKMVKVDTVSFVYNIDKPDEKWKIFSNDKKIDLTFYPENSRNEDTNMFFVASKSTQFVGIFEGSVKNDNGEEFKIERCYGWAEDHYAKW